jgi:alpha-L-fucosidase
LASAAAQPATPNDARPRPTLAQLAWQDFELGLVYHYDLPVFAPEGWTPVKGALDPNLYQPRKLDTGQWLEAAKAMGCRYAIFTATHFNGFLQWQSNLYPYGLRQTRWRGGKADVFGDFVKSCHKYGIAPGVYLSCHRNAWWKVWRYRVNWGQGGEGQAEFARVGAKMTEELCSRYGPLCEIWYDAGLLHPDDGGPDVLPVVDKYQKKIVFYHSPQRREHRWIGNESGVAGYPCWATLPSLEAANQAHHGGMTKWRDLLAHGDPDGKLWSPAMVDVPIRNHEWFWRPNDDHKVYRPEALVEMYYDSVGRNCTLILGATPDRDGLIPQADFDSYAAFGREIRRRFGRPLAETRGVGARVQLRLPRPERIDHVSVMEEIAEGENVREYVIEGLMPGNRWEKICGGVSIGHKRIQKFPPVEVAEVRLRVTRSAGPVKIRQLAVYSTS